MNNIQISSLIRYKTGKEIKQVAADCGCSRPNFYMVINGRLKKSQFYQMISDLTGKSLSELWPDKFKEEQV